MWLTLPDPKLASGVRLNSKARVGQTIVMPTGDRHDNTRRPSTGFFQGGLESNDLGNAR